PRQELEIRLDVRDRSQQEAGEVEEVGAEVVEHAAAGGSHQLAPAAGPQAVPILVVSPEEEGLAHVAGRHPAAQLLDAVEVAVGEGHLVHPSAGDSGAGHLLGLGNSPPQRLLAEDVFTVIESAQGLLAMDGVGRADRMPSRSSRAHSSVGSSWTDGMPKRSASASAPSRRRPQRATTSAWGWL